MGWGSTSPQGRTTDATDYPDRREGGLDWPHWLTLEVPSLGLVTKDIDGLLHVILWTLLT